ncbi:MAG: sugar porter family MFS transporter [Flavobacteriia bacterium]|nr:sugar porter family MFS transporter [Flavobacteriia bacterium]
MKSNSRATIAMIALIVALGGLLMGFDASVISGVNKFIEAEFELSKIELGWAVSSLTLVAALAMLAAGPLSDRYGRRAILRVAAVLYAISAVGSALAPDFLTLVIARMIGGLGVGASLILAPMYIAEIAPSEQRGFLVSFNQLNIVVGISLAFFSNYAILQLGDSGKSWVQSLGIADHQWRWMLGLEAIPAFLYWVGLFFVPRSPRWLMMKGKSVEAEKIMARFFSPERLGSELKAIATSLKEDIKAKQVQLSELFRPGLKLVLTIAFVIAILQQITGINSVFFYAPMIFEQSGLGTDASFMQAILVGLVNLVFTVVAMLIIDRIGRKPLLLVGVTGIIASMFVLSYSFGQATYELNEESFKSAELEIIPTFDASVYDSKGDFEMAVTELIGADVFEEKASEILNSSIRVDGLIVLIAVLAFVASFAVSLGPVMWVLLSELFPTRIRGIAVSVVGLVNSMVSFLVQLVFPWELDVLGSSLTFLIYGLFAVGGLIFVIRVVPETKGKTLEQIEAEFVTN